MSVFDVLREKLKEIEYHDKHRKTVYLGDVFQIIYQVEKELAPKTNADRIRAMSDEELAEFIANDCLEIADEICGSCPQETTVKCGSGGGCVEHIVSWLKKEMNT